MREEPDVAADGGERRLRVERAELGGEALAVHDVVGVHARDHSAEAALEAGAERRDEALVRRGDDPEALVVRGKALGDGARAVLRAVVDHDALPTRERLARHAAEAGVERRPGVVCRQQDRDLRRAHRANSRKYWWGRNVWDARSRNPAASASRCVSARESFSCTGGPTGSGRL